MQFPLTRSVNQRISFGLLNSGPDHRASETLNRATPELRVLRGRRILEGRRIIDRRIHVGLNPATVDLEGGLAVKNETP